MIRLGLLQLSSTDDPEANLAATRAQLAEAAARGASFVLTPEITNCVSGDRGHQRAVLRPEAEDPTLAALRRDAARHGIWLLIGSLALRSEDPDRRFANRSFLVDPSGGIVARYDKIHMFDVDISETERYRESAAYRPGDRAVLARTPWGDLGMTICYDLRFPALYRRLARAGASLLAVPAAFSPVSGAAHWHALLRARAIETGCFVLAPAQTGAHGAMAGAEDTRIRRTFGHSLVVSPWGEVLLDAGTAPGCHVLQIDPAAVAEARARIPSITCDPPWEGP